MSCFLPLLLLTIVAGTIIGFARTAEMRKRALLLARQAGRQIAHARSLEEAEHLRRRFEGRMLAHSLTTTDRQMLIEQATMDARQEVLAREALENMAVAGVPAPPAILLPLNFAPAVPISLPASAHCPRCGTVDSRHGRYCGNCGNQLQ